MYTNCACTIVVLGILFAQARPTMPCIRLVVLLRVACHTTEDRLGTKVIHCGDVLLRHYKSVHVHVRVVQVINVKYTDICGVF